jgi:light-regulated signal transduction histidine kinase (bacteriophytochrome)
MLLTNLIGNALKYRHKERSPEICINVAERPSEWLIRVSDNGIGIDPANTERIFELFKRLHARTEYPGTGVGLAVCQRIV